MQARRPSCENLSRLTRPTTRFFKSCNNSSCRMPPKPDSTDAPHERLLLLETELKDALLLATEASRPVELDQQSVGRLSRMDSLQQQAMAKNNRRSLELRLKQVVAALARHERGDYGSCLRCEEDISPKRLNAKPEAPFCRQCQSVQERR